MVPSAAFHLHVAVRETQAALHEAVHLQEKEEIMTQERTQAEAANPGTGSKDAL